MSKKKLLKAFLKKLEYYSSFDLKLDFFKQKAEFKKNEQNKYNKIAHLLIALLFFAFCISLLLFLLQAAISILRTLTKPHETEKDRSLDLEFLLAPPKTPSLDTFDTVSAIDLAEQVRYVMSHVMTHVMSPFYANFHVKFHVVIHIMSNLSCLESCQLPVNF